MEPLGIVASVIAVCQAGERTLSLIARIRRALHAHEDIRELHQDIERLKLVLQALTTIPEICDEATEGSMCHIVRDCHIVLCSLETTLTACLSPNNPTGAVSKAFVRARWFKHRQRTELQRLRLRDTFSTLGLYLQIYLAQIWHKNPLQGLLAESRLAHSELRLSEIPRHISSPRIHQVSYGSCRKVKSAWELGGEHATPPFILRQSSPTSCTSVADIGRTPSIFHLPESASTCTGRCTCDCHESKVQFGQFQRGHLGSFFLCRSGRILPLCSCTSLTCKNSGSFYASLLLLPPLWLSRTSLLLAMTNAPRLRVSLSFPRLLPPDNAFFVAIRYGQHERMQELLSSGAAHIADVAAPFGLSALQLATSHGQAGASRLLIAAGATLLPSQWNWSPRDMLEHQSNNCLIHSNLSSGELVRDLVKVFAPDTGPGGLEAQSDLLGLERTHLTRVHKAVLGLSLEHVEDIDAQSLGLLIDEVDSYNRTPLFWSAKTGNEKALRHLLDSGANTDLVDLGGATALHVAAGQGNLACVRHLTSRGIDLERRDRLGITPLHYACARGDPAVIDALVAAGADIEAANCVGESPIFRGTHSRNVASVRKMVELGASLSFRDAWGYTAMHDTVLTDSHDALEYLLPLSDCSTRLLDGKTILHTAARHSDQKTIEILLQANLVGLNPDVIDDAGFTALEYLEQRPVTSELFECFCALAFKTVQAYACFQTSNVTCTMEEDIDEVFEDAVAFQLAPS